MRRLVQGDVVIGVTLLAVAVWYGLEAQGFRPGRSGDPGAGMFPGLLALLLGGLSLWMIAAALIAPAPAVPETPDQRAARRRAARAGFLRAAAGAALTIAFVALFEPLGYILSTGLYAAAISLLFRPGAPWVAALAGVGAVGFLYLLFGVLLNARLPMGPLG